MRALRVKGIHYGLTLLYSYLLPALDVEETARGFRFEFVIGPARGLKCDFNESSLEAECTIGSSACLESVDHLLGLDKHRLFRELCMLLWREGCVAELVTLMYTPSYRRVVSYSTYLSRNTDYYANTVRWVKEAIDRGCVMSTSYVAREFNEVKSSIDATLEKRLEHLEEAVELMKIRGFGVKLAKAYLLHSYGLTEHAPVDRHYASFLGVAKVSVPKRHCAEMLLECNKCSRVCPYSVSTVRYGAFNGVVQSLTYILGRFTSGRKSALEKILVKDADYYADAFSRALGALRHFHYSSGGRLGPSDFSTQAKTISGWECTD